MFKLNRKFGAEMSFYSLCLSNAKATQYTRSLNGIYHPHCLVQWSHHCLHVCIAVHFPWLPNYIDITQTILVILTMVGLFLDRWYIYTQRWTKVGLQWFHAKVCNTRINNDTRINSISCTPNCKSTFAYSCIYIHTYTHILIKIYMYIWIREQNSHTKFCKLYVLNVLSLKIF